jgi:tetratricopeptide (TPR) repeat protein
MRNALFVALFVLALGAPRHASAQSVPEPGLAAEASGQWDEAIRVYRQALERDPQRGDLWIRIADIESTRGNVPAAAAALRQAAAVLPRDPNVYRRLSQAYALTNEPRAALEAILQALALAPDNPDYLGAAATLATWYGDYGLAARSYRRLQEVGGAPSDEELALALARVSAWAGETDEAVAAYRRYLGMRPEMAGVWLELARTEAWRGNYAAALEAAGIYRARFGESDAYLREVAAIRARSGQPSEAVKLIDPLLKQDPSSHELNVTRTIALAMQQRPRETFESLDSVRRLNPSDRETRSAERLVRANLSSTAEPGFSFYTDSDRLRVTRLTPSVTGLFVTGTQVSAGYERQILEAPASGGLGRADGASARYEQGWAAVGQKIGRVTVQGMIGAATADDQRLTTYALSTRIRPSDAFAITAASSRGFFVVSPRTVELGLTDRHHQVDFEWAPGVLYRVSSRTSYQRISDGNERWQALVAPRRVVARTESFNLDLGFSAYVLGTTKDLGNGYYDPRRYESYAAVVYPYFKASENVGVAASIGAGLQREQALPSFRFGGNASVEVTVGIYRPWVLKVSASATNNQRGDSGAFEGYSSGVVLIRRF